MTIATQGDRPFAIASVLARTGERAPDAPAIVHDATERSWGNVAGRVSRQAAALRSVSDLGDRIAIFARNGPHYFEASFAVPWADRVFVPINERLVLAEIERLLNNCPCAVLLFDAEFVDTARTLAEAGRIRCLFLGDADLRPDFADSFSELSRRQQPADPVVPDQDAVWGIIFTGGTTGDPKGVMLTHGAIEYNMATIAHHLDWGDAPRFLHVTPLFHLAGLGPSFAVTLWGGTHHFMPKFSVPGFLDIMGRYSITATALVPTMIAWIASEEAATRDLLPSWHYMGYGASAIQEATLRRLLDRLPQLRLTQFYGQTEACGNLTVLSPDDHRLDGPRPERLRSAGQPAIGVELAVVHDDGTHCKTGETGEITARSNGLFLEYFDHPGLTAEVLDGGWLHTGDVGYLDECGYLYVTDRMKDMIVTGGENVASSEVEQVLYAHPDILQCAVVGVPDPEWGERIHAVCVVRPNTALDHTAIENFCDGKLARYKIPKSTHISVCPLPVSALGKIRKDLLRNMKHSGER